MHLGYQQHRRDAETCQCTGSPRSTKLPGDDVRPDSSGLPAAAGLSGIRPGGCPPNPDAGNGLPEYASVSVDSRNSDSEARWSAQATKPVVVVAVLRIVVVAIRDGDVVGIVVVERAAPQFFPAPDVAPRWKTVSASTAVRNPWVSACEA